MSVALASPVQGLSGLGAHGVDGAAVGEGAEVAVHSCQSDPGSPGAQLGMQVLRAAEISARSQELVKCALLARGSLRRRGGGEGGWRAHHTT